MEPGKGEKLFFTRKKVFLLSPNPSPLFKKSGVFYKVRTVFYW